VPIADEDRLVVPDTLGTTIKGSFLEGPARLAPADDSQRGRCCHLYIGAAVVTCLETRWPPGFWFSRPAPCRYSQPRAGRPATECERGGDLSAFAGTPPNIRGSHALASAPRRAQIIQFWLALRFRLRSGVAHAALRLRLGMPVAGSSAAAPAFGSGRVRARSGLLAVAGRR
jgi:hypothetical protein